MPKIRELFDSSRALTRPIEKVITYQNCSEEQLRAEISEYVVTEHIEQRFEDLLGKMQTAQAGGGGHEIGVWVSGFYGSGKSSFTKYLGFALDREMKVGGDTFLKLLQNQLGSASTKARFNQVSGVYDAAIIFLDLASEMLAGASMEDISTVLYLKVLQWAGYSEDLKVAELERKLEADGKLEKFKKRAKEKLDGIDWVDAHNQPLAANQVAAQLATEFYPNLFKNISDFSDLTLHVNKAENKRAEEMIELIRRKSGKKNVVFIIDEVGQYVSAKPSLILNLDGLSKNLKQIGGGSVWIFATAQQTLTDDNPTAALNSPGLYKLKDRFPIQVHLEASDIKEICHKRLLTKSAEGEKQLNSLFDNHGASLRTATHLTDAGVYDVELKKKIFVDLYPFLPAHFEILLQLLGRLAKKTGGLGLRSAIKVVQEVLIERGKDQSPLADAPVGRLANTVTFYDSLRRDIQSSFPHVVEGIQRVEHRLPGNAMCLQVAKSIAVLQILENLPVTVSNIAALIQSDVASPSLKDDVEKAVDAMLKDGMIPLGEKNGSLRFLTQAAVTLQKQFDQIEYRNADVRAELNGVLRSIFKPLPSARLAQVRPVTAGLRVMIGGGHSVSLEGEKEPVQIHVEFAPATSYDSIRDERETDSRSTKEQASIFLLGRSEPDTDQLAVTLVRCCKFLDAHRTASDPETQEFIRIVDARHQRTSAEIERKLADALQRGSFVAHGAHEAVASRGTDVLEASKSFLADTAAKIFDHYDEAPHQAQPGFAEKFLTTPIDRITSKEDPLSLVTRAGGKPQVKTDHKALISICDYLGQSGQVEGRRLLDHFAAPRYGWSKDTTCYLLAAAFLGGLIKLRISGQDHQVKSDDSLAAFASNKAFGPVGVSLREVTPRPEELIRASDRLRDLTGENILPLEDEIAVAAKKHFPIYQAAFAPLAVELRGLGIPEATANRAEELVDDLTEVVSGDGSDAVKRLGGTTSSLYDDLLWARNLKKALENGLRQRLSHLGRLRRDIDGLPDSGILGNLKAAAAETLAAIDDIQARTSFFEEGAALGTHADALDKLIAETVTDLASQQEKLRASTLARWTESRDWQDIDGEDRDWFTQEVEKLSKVVTSDADGLRDLLNHDFTLNHHVREFEIQLHEMADKNRSKREESADGGGSKEPDKDGDKEEPGDAGGGREPDKDNDGEVPGDGGAGKDPGGKPGSVQKTLLLPKDIRTAQEIEDLIKQLNAFLAAIEAGTPLRLTCQIIHETK